MDLLWTCQKLLIWWSGGELFSNLRIRGVNSIFLRLLLCIHRNQQCDVKWGGKCSHRFSVGNGVRQGAVSLAIFFSLYINEKFIILRRTKLGCHVNGEFYGCFGYANDLFLISAELVYKLW